MTARQQSDLQLQDQIDAGRYAEQLVDSPAFIKQAELLVNQAGNMLRNVDISGSEGPHNAVFAILNWRAAVDFGVNITNLAKASIEAREELQRREQVERERASKSDGRSQGKPRT